jgi:hypothetical protein
MGARRIGKGAPIVVPVLTSISGLVRQGSGKIDLNLSPPVVMPDYPDFALPYATNQ